MLRLLGLWGCGDRGSDLHQIHRPVGPGSKRRVGEGGSYPISPNGPRDVLERLLAPVLEGKVEPTRGILLHARRDADAAWLSQAFEPSRDVDPIADDVAILDEDIADIDADAELDATIRGQRRIAFRHCGLHLGRAARRVDDAGELGQEAVAGGVDDTAAMGGNLR